MRNQSTEAPSPARLAVLLLDWYTPEFRDLPWRGLADPWAIWVSEAMLQQTRASVVRERFAPFLATFPTPAALAEASDDRLLTAWQGLGYYRRARKLREAARILAERHGGKLPEDPDEFLRLPGVGPYTRGAVYSIAFGLPLPALDGNVERVVGRLLGLEQDPRRNPGKKRLLDFLEALLRKGPPGDLNQALMDLGALLCLPRQPRCPACPWRDACRALGSGSPEAYPPLPAPTKPEQIRTSVCLARRGDLVLARRIPAGQINEGQLCLPGLGLPRPAGPDLAAHLRATHGLAGAPVRLLGVFTHSITRYRIRVEVHQWAPPPARPCRGLDYADPSAPLPWTTLARKALGSYLHLTQ